MTISEAARLLNAMYFEGSAKGAAATAVHLFGIRYAAELDGMPLKEIAIRAGISPNYGTEIRKGVNLARYVRIVDRAW